MNAFVVIIVLFAVISIWVLSNKTETYKGERNYKRHDLVNYPGGDLGPATWVKDTVQCQKLCDAKGNDCFGYTISKNADTTRPVGQQRQCYLKGQTAFADKNKTPDKNWNSYILGSYYDYWRGAGANWAGSKDWKGNKCGGAQVILYADKDRTQSAKWYGCGVFDVTADFPPNKGNGVSAYAVPPGLKLTLYGSPNYKIQKVVSYGRMGQTQTVSTAAPAQWSSEITGTGDLAQYGNGVWNDRVEKISIEKA